jgi:predicted small integral membrane protein
MQQSYNNVFIYSGGPVYTRTSKATLVWAVALFATLVVLNNLTDYSSNYHFVQHVLSMDSVFPGNRGMWRAIDSPLLHHAFYNCIIFVEAVIAVLCWLGGFRLCRSIDNPARFNKAKGMAILGLTLGMLLWFTGFMTLGGEWFLMWQSSDWNGQQAAFRLVAILGITLVYLAHADGEGDA